MSTAPPVGRGCGDGASYPEAVTPDPDPAVAEGGGAGAALSTGAVARRLGVAPTTLRTWEHRYSIGPATRQDGKHRRWTPQDIARLEEMCRLTSQGVPPAEAARAALRPLPGGGGRPSARPAPRAVLSPGGRDALPLGDVRQECRGLARAAVRLDAPAVEELLDAALAEHGLAGAWEEVFAPTLHAVGRKWASSGERYVEVEHLLSWQISSAVRRLRTVRGPAGIAPALLACVPGEQHTLPLEALTAALGQRGLPARMFGAALPAEALHAAVRRIGPSVVVLWAQSRSTADRAPVQLVSGVEWGLRGARANPALLLAGPGWTTTPHVPGTGRLHGLRSGTETVESLLVG